jgi:signal transduction histidine kinase
LFSRLRSSFAAKLLAAGLILSLLVIGGISAYLLVSRDQQTRAAAISNANNRAAVMREVLESFTADQSLLAAESLAKQPALAEALQSQDPASALSTRFAGSATADLSDEILVVTDATGTPLYVRAASDLGRLAVPTSAAREVVRRALGGARCTIDNQPGACGLDVPGRDEPAYAVATPVLAGGARIGAVAYIAPLQYQLSRFSNLFQFQTAFIPASDPGAELRQQRDGFVLSTAPAEVQAGIRSHSDVVEASYAAPSASGPATPVAASFVAVKGADGRSVAGYLGVEIPLSVFVGDERTDELTLGVITLFVLLATAIAVFLFVETFVRRPIRRLERGVARIAGGDYTTGVDVRSNDELGRLATSVNRMRDSISMYVGEIESARARLDGAVQRVSGVSRALTTTTGGLDALQREVVRTVADIAGPGSMAVLAVREGDDLQVRAAHPADSELADMETWSAPEPLLHGEVVRSDHDGRALLAVPMFYQDSVVGALTVVKQSGAPAAPDDEERVLAVLANNTAIAMENARLFEQERETVRRLRELDSMKTDFLSTVQHELRTPLTAILGLSDLMEMCWEMWDDSPKLEAVRDIQVAAKNLYDIVETIIDFSAVEGETVGLNPSMVMVEEAAHKAVEAVGERYKGGLPIAVEVDADASISVFADPERFEQVLRALVDNAVKFSDGRGRVRLVARRAPDRSEVTVTVSDKGIGISDEDLPRIFDRFYQVDNSATRRYGGTGMGLALVKRLVQAHGARVDVKTALDKGTKFILTWPAAAAASSGEARTVAEARGEAPSTRRKRAEPSRDEPRRRERKADEAKPGDAEGELSGQASREAQAETASVDAG